MDNHIEHLRIYHFYKYDKLQSKSHSLGYEVAQTPQVAYSQLTNGRILEHDRMNDLHTIWYNEAWQLETLKRGTANEASLLFYNRNYLCNWSS